MTPRHKPEVMNREDRNMKIFANHVKAIAGKAVRTAFRTVGGHPVKARQREAPDGSRYWTVEVMLDDLEELVGAATAKPAQRGDKPHPLQKNLIGPNTIAEMEGVLNGIGSARMGQLGAINFGAGRMVTAQDAHKLLDAHAEAVAAGLTWVKPPSASAPVPVPEPGPDPEHEAHVERCEHLRIWVEGTCKRAIDHDWVMPEIVMPLETKLKEMYFKDAGATIPVLVDRILDEPGVATAGTAIILPWLGQYMSEETYDEWQSLADEEEAEAMYLATRPDEEEDVVFRPE